MPAAARLFDLVSHAPDSDGLAPGPGCATVEIECGRAWRGLPPGLAPSVEEVSRATAELMVRPVLTPADAAPGLAAILQALHEAATACVRHGVPGAVEVFVTEGTALDAANASLSATWTTASAAPGGAPTASAAYTQGIRLAVSKCVSSYFLIYGAVTDMHLCPVSPHGPGFVTRASRTVLIGNLPAARCGDVLWEACGGPNAIVSGGDSVRIG